MLHFRPTVSRFEQSRPFELGVEYIRSRVRNNLVEDGFQSGGSATLPWVSEDITTTFGNLYLKASYIISVAEELRLTIGPQLGTLIHNSKEGAEGSEGYIDSFETSNNFDVGINMGASIDILPRLAFNLAAFNGLLAVEAADVPNPSYARHRYYSVGLSLQLN